MASAARRFLAPARPCAGGACRLPAAGFTMVELIVVMVVIGVVGAIGAASFFSRTGFDGATFAEEGAAMLGYAQKLAIAQNRPVYVRTSAQGLYLCYGAAAPCPDDQRVGAPSGANGGSAATRAFCTASNGDYVPDWYCEAAPSGVAVTPSPAGLAAFYFNGLGRPYALADTGDSSFTGLSLLVSGGDLRRTLSVAKETGHVE